MSFLGLHESNYTILGCMNREITRHIGARTCKFGCTSLTNEDLAVFDFLATKALDAKALASIVMDVFGGTASFYV